MMNVCRFHCGFITDDSDSMTVHDTVCPNGRSLNIERDFGADLDKMVLNYRHLGPEGAQGPFQCLDLVGRAGFHI